MGRSIVRTRSLRKMKLPLSRPSTSSSPSGYASVISAPSSATREAIVASSKMIDFTGLPPVRRRTSGVLSIDSQCLRAPLRKEGVGATDAGNPDYTIGIREHRPRFPAAAGHLGFLEAPHQETP